MLDSLSCCCSHFWVHQVVLPQLWPELSKNHFLFPKCQVPESPFPYWPNSYSFFIVCNWCLLLEEFNKKLVRWTRRIQLLTPYSTKESTECWKQEWIAIPFSRGSSAPRDWTCISCSLELAGDFFFLTTEPSGKPTK